MRIIRFFSLPIALLTALGLVSCATTEGERDQYAKTKQGAGIGAAVGAVAGAIVAGDNKKGAIVGGALGAAAGGAYGRKLDKQAQELERIAETQRTDRGIITKLKGDLTFETGKSTLSSEGRQSLNEIAEILKKYPENRITVVGHTDATGPDSLNERLSKERALTVKNLLTQKGVSSASVETMGAGSSDPIASNATAQGRQANRRVELAITMDEERLAE